MTAAQTETLRAKIRTKESQIEDAASASRRRVETKKKTYLSRKEEIEDKKQDRSMSIEADKDKFLLSNRKLSRLGDYRRKQKDQTRCLLQQPGMPFSLAHIRQTDVADVTRELKWVSIVWFGSSTYRSTIGTILALISHSSRSRHLLTGRNSA